MKSAEHSCGDKRGERKDHLAGSVVATDGHGSGWVHSLGEFTTGYIECGCLGNNDLSRQKEIMRTLCHLHEEGRANISCFILILLKMKDIFPNAKF